MADGLEEKRAQLQIDLHQLLVTSVDGRGTCPCDKVKADALKALQEQYTFPQIQQVSISDIIRDILQIVCDGHDPGIAFNTGQPVGAPIAFTIYQALERLRKDSRLCLICIREGGSDPMSCEH